MLSTSEFDINESESTEKDLEEYQYKELKALNSIRVLSLRPAGKDKANEIVCELLEEDLDSIKVEYEALSWAWGSAPWNQRIRICDKGEDFFVKVPVSLAYALRALRRRKKARRLWIDAICIDQDQPNEKNKQVPMMSKIYGGARRVCVWLGQGDDDSKMALNFIKTEVLKLQDFDKLCDDHTASPKWNAMLNLMKRPWFSRRWVVQEIALAKDAMIYCGTVSIAWRDFADAVQLFVEVETATHRLSEVMKKDPKFYHVPGWFEYVSALGASLLVDATGTLFRVSKDEGRQALLSLEYLVSTLSVFEVSEPRDSIYSLLAIAKDTQPIAVIHGQIEPSADPAKAQLTAWASRNVKARPYKVDYQLPFIDICQEFIWFSINQSDQTRALDIICRPWAPSVKKRKKVKKDGKAIFKDLNGSEKDGEKQDMPSWIPRSTGAAFTMFTNSSGELKMGRKNADPLVGLPTLSQRNYSAAETRRINRSRLGFKKRDMYYSMYVEGFILDTVERVEMPSQSGNIPEEWIALGEWHRTEKDPPPEELWRTLVADRGRHGRNPPTYYARACRESITKGLASGALNTTELINDGRCSVVSEFFRRVQAVIWNRCLMRTKCGRLGIVRKDVLVGDLVCILYGCSVPVILRRYPKKNFVEEERVDEEEREKGAIRMQRGFRARKLRLAEERLTNAKKIVENGNGAKPTEVNGALSADEENAQQLRQADSNPVNKGKPQNPMEHNDDGSSKLKPKPETKPKPNGLKLKRAPTTEPLLQPKSDDDETNDAQPENKVDNHKAKEDSKLFYYEFIGECYVHGMMDGEAIKYQNDHEIKAQVFELR